MWVLLVPVGAAAVGLTIGAFADRVYPSIIRLRSRARFDREGGVWVGVATFAPAEVDQHPVVCAALANVGAYYGEGLSGYGAGSRVVNGVLWVFPDRVCWEPNRYLGRGEAHRWEIPLEEVAEVEIRNSRFQRAGTAVMHTANGRVRFRVTEVTDFGDHLNRVIIAIHSGDNRGQAIARATSAQSATPPGELPRLASDEAEHRLRIAKLVALAATGASTLAVLVGLALSNELVFTSAASVLMLSVLALYQLWALRWVRARRERQAAREPGHSPG